MKQSGLLLCYSDPQSSFLAARYLNTLDSQFNAESEIVQWLCGHYFKEVVNMPSVIEWSRMGKLFFAGAGGVTTHPESNTALAELAPHLVLR